MASSTNTLRFRIGVASIVILLVHICLAAAAFFNLGESNSIVRVYRQLVLLGPFFAESRIKHSHFLAVQFLYDGKWTEVIKPSKANFAAYANAPWRIDKMSLVAYERYLGNAVSELSKEKSSEEIQHSKAFRELSMFLVGEYSGDRTLPPDSVKLIYGLHEYIPALRSYKADTLFVHTYHPETIGRKSK